MCTWSAQHVQEGQAYPAEGGLQRERSSTAPGFSPVLARGWGPSLLHPHKSAVLSQAPAAFAAVSFVAILSHSTRAHRPLVLITRNAKPSLHLSKDLSPYQNNAATTAAHVLWDARGLKVSHAASQGTPLPSSSMRSDSTTSSGSSPLCPPMMYSWPRE